MIRSIVSSRGITFDGMGDDEGGKHSFWSSFQTYNIVSHVVHSQLLGINNKNKEEEDIARRRTSRGGGHEEEDTRRRTSRGGPCEEEDVARRRM
jgi:hypothetical protein